MRGDPNLHIEDASAIARAATAAAAITGWTVSVLRPAMITIVPTAGVAGVPPMVVDDVCRSRGRSVYQDFRLRHRHRNATVLDRTSAVASAIVLSFIAAFFRAAFDHVAYNITLQAGVS